MVLRLFHDQHLAFLCCISNVLADRVGSAGPNRAIDRSQPSSGGPRNIVYRREEELWGYPPGPCFEGQA